METLEGERDGLEKEAVVIVRDKLKAKLDADTQIGEKRPFLLGLVGGRSIGRILKLLTREKEINWKYVHIFLLDERGVSLDSSESNYKQLVDTLGEVVPKNNLHSFDFINDTLGDYGAKLKEYSPEGKFDLVILSAGEDGHVGSLFPNHDSIKKDGELFILVENAPKDPPKRMSASRRLLGRSETAVLLFFGAEKAKAYKKFMSEKYDVEAVPAKIVRSIKESYVCVDEEILSLLGPQK